MELLSRPLSVEEKQRLNEYFLRISSQYPEKQSLAMPLLFACQELLGFVSKEAIEFVAEKSELSPAHVLELATFYTMFHLKPVGKYHIQVCRTASCFFCGGQELIEFIKGFVGKDQLVPSDDGLFSWELVECIGSCGTAPAVLINDRLFECVTVEALKNLLERIKRERPELKLSVFRDDFSADFLDYPFSRILKND